MSVISNAQQLAAKWERRAKQLEPQMRKATQDATKTLYAESKKQMQQLIYDKPVPTKAQVAAEKGTLGKNGKIGVAFAAKSGSTKKSVGFVASKKYGTKPAWKRTGNLKRSEKMKIISAYVGIVENPATSGKKKSPYAYIRHEKKNTRFPAPWRANAIKKTQPAIRKIYQNAMHDALNAI